MMPRAFFPRPAAHGTEVPTKRASYAGCMSSRVGWLAGIALFALTVGCAGEGAPASPAPAGTTAPAATASLTMTPAPSATSSPAATPAPTPARQDIRAARLRVPVLGIDAPVQGSQVIPDTSVPLPGCPAPPPGSTTLTVPNFGLATPDEALDGIENKAWIFGHSRWQSAPGIFLRLQDISVGDELFVDGVLRHTSEPVANRRFVVERLYIADIDSGATLVAAATPAEIPAEPLVILQTSIREDGYGKPWILDQQRVLAKSRSVVQGSLDDPCKYLLLFVFARAS